MLGSRGLASLGPFLGAPAGPRGRLKYWGLGDRGLASPVPLLGATQHVAGIVDGVRDGGRGVPAPQIINFVEEIPFVRVFVEQIVVCQCHRSWRF